MKTRSTVKLFDKWDYIFIAALLLHTLIFNLFHAASFFTVTEGWFSDFANYMLSGQVPYRDFNLYIPPLFPAVITFLTAVFGHSFLILRMYGIIERMIVVLLAYIILRRVFRSGTVLIVLFASSIVYISNLQDIFYGYYQTSLLLTLLRIWRAVLLCENEDAKRIIRHAAAFGISAGLTTICKHSTGVIMFFALEVISQIVLLRQENRRPLRVLAISVLSYIGTILVCLLPLIIAGAFRPMISQLFGGSSSKGSLLAILFGFIPRTMTKEAVADMLLMCGIIFIAALSQYLKKRMGTSQTSLQKPATQKVISAALGAVQLVLLYLVLKPILDLSLYSFLAAEVSLKFYALVFCLGLVLLAAAFLQDRIEKGPAFVRCVLLLGSIALLTAVYYYVYTHELGYIHWSGVRDLRERINYSAFYIEVGLSAYYLITGLLKNDMRCWKRLLVFVGAWGIMYIHGMSNTIEDHAMLLSLAIILGLALEADFSFFNKVKNVVVYIFCLILVFSIFVQRCYLPYSWWGVNGIARQQRVCKGTE